MNVILYFIGHLCSYTNVNIIRTELCFFHTKHLINGSDYISLFNFVEFSTVCDLLHNIIYRSTFYRIEPTFTTVNIEYWNQINFIFKSFIFIFKNNVETLSIRNASQYLFIKFKYRKGNIWYDRSTFVYRSEQKKRHSTLRITIL